jgi:ElaB/YqjD/DUF883 family membrane-anchored ribosome-binding protein
MDYPTVDSDSNVQGSPATDERFSDRAARMVDQAKTAGRAAVGTLDDQREAAARTLSSAATKLHNKASEYSERLTGAAHKTADTLESTADFVREHPFTRIKDDVAAAARRNPGAALIVAACVGFLVGRALTRD